MFPLLGTGWGFVDLNWVGCSRKRWMGWQPGWRLGEGNVAFTLPLVGIVRVLGSAECALATYGRWSRQSEAGDV